MYRKGVRFFHAHGGGALPGIPGIEQSYSLAGVFERMQDYPWQAMRSVACALIYSCATDSLLLPRYSAA